MIAAPVNQLPSLQYLSADPLKCLFLALVGLSLLPAEWVLQPQPGNQQLPKCVCIHVYICGCVYMSVCVLKWEKCGIPL